MNLLTDSWLPAIRSGLPALIRIAEIVDPAVTGLDMKRADLEIGTLEMLVGILTMACAPVDNDAWLAFAKVPPTPDELQEALDPFAAAFDLLGDGPRFMQFPVTAKKLKEANPISRMLMGAPGENAEKKNLDIITHRDPDLRLAPGVAAAALYTHQLRIQGVGAGHMSSTRGGEHVTVLVDLRPFMTAPALWTLIWGNVPTLEKGPLDASHLDHALPWMRQDMTANREKLGDAKKLSRRPDIEVFFAASRRFWLIADASGLVSGYAALSYGLTYHGWEHPLSPRDTGKRGPEYRKPAASAGKLGATLAGSGIIHSSGNRTELPALVRARQTGNGIPAMIVAEQSNEQADIIRFRVAANLVAPADTCETEALERALEVHQHLSGSLRSCWGKLEKAGITPAHSVENACRRFSDQTDLLLSRARRENRPSGDPDFIDSWRKRQVAMAVGIFEAGFADALLRGAPAWQTAIGAQRGTLFKIIGKQAS